MEGILRSIVAAGYQFLQGRGLVLFRFDPVSELFPDEWRLVDGEIVRRYSTQVSTGGLTHAILQGGTSLVVGDATEAGPLSPNMPKDVRSFVGMPVFSGGAPWGVLYISDTRPHAFAKEDVAFLESLARQLGASTTESQPNGAGNVELSTVRVLAATVDAKDHYTRHHSTNVSFYARLVAREMNLDPAEVRRIDLAGLLHDIGKIAVPDQILQKPGPLTPEERLVVNTHAAIGANILTQAPHLQHLVALVRHHHERYDGKGYPDGLRGDEIALGAMILNLADSFDTMTTRRVYRSPLTLDAAMEEVRRCSGTQFHPEVVRAMDSLVAKSMAAREPWVLSLGKVQPASPNLGPDSAWHGILGSPDRDTQHRDPLDFLVEARLLAARHDLAALLQQAGEQVMDYWSADAVQIYLAFPQRATLQLAWSEGSLAGQRFLATCRAEDEIPMTHGLVGWSALTNQGLTIPDARRDPRWPYPMEFEGPLSAMVVPIGTNGTAAGAVQLVARGEGRFGWADVKVMKVFCSLLAHSINQVVDAPATKDYVSVDPLTGVRNSNYLRLWLQQLEQYPWVSPLSVAFLDGDDLKGINDRYGYEAGDQVIMHIARSLQAWRRPEDVLVRLAGDEFVVFFGGLGLPEAMARLERIRMTISEIPVELPNGRRVYVSVSCGVTELTAQGPHQAVRAAEQAMCNAKRTGKNRIWTVAG